ncbi:hypothetical protein AK830_g12558 [Neonectria ditissima]|uniref:Starter acyltransferase (SAT) domain-containing protein n=1 Tax=Neonectria ditissima TaxID=78410 RepID=A0A0P7AYS9_9HYPO|nr:hypothetical protein AK830_g12558 [Neonectria ditissima]
MASATLPGAAVSAAIFSPQSNPPKPQYLSDIRSRLLQDAALKPLKDAILGLPQTWDSLASWRQEMSSLQNARQRVQSLAQWLESGVSEAIESDTSGLVTLPLLTTIHMVQYLDYLRQTQCTHAEFLDSLKNGGVQGYCIGLLSAVVVATSANEEELLNRAAAGLRVALAIGAFGDLAEALSGGDWTTLAIRLRQGDKAEEEELLRRFPGVSNPPPPPPRPLLHQQ